MRALMSACEPVSPSAVAGQRRDAGRAAEGLWAWTPRTAAYSAMPGEGLTGSTVLPSRLYHVTRLADSRPAPLGTPRRIESALPALGERLQDGGFNRAGMLEQIARWRRRLHVCAVRTGKSLSEPRPFKRHAPR